MSKAELSMRKAHGEMGTFFVGFGEYLELRDRHKRTDVLLKFRHTQYAPLGSFKILKNNDLF